MELPSTSPTGRKPTSRTSRNSFTDRSEVKIAPGCPGLSSASLRIASCGTPSTSRSLPCCSVIALLQCRVRGARGMRTGSSGDRRDHRVSWAEPHPRGLPPLRVEREDRQRRRVSTASLAEVRDRGADDGRLDYVVAPSFLDRALVLADIDGHLLQYDTVRAVPGDVSL